MVGNFMCNFKKYCKGCALLLFPEQLFSTRDTDSGKANCITVFGASVFLFLNCEESLQQSSSLSSEMTGKTNPIVHL